MSFIIKKFKYIDSGHTAVIGDPEADRSNTTDNLEDAIKLADGFLALKDIGAVLVSDESNPGIAVYSKTKLA